MVKKIFTFNIVDRYKLKSGDDVEMKRTIFNNLVFCTNIEDPKTSNIILMNLRTFRRELISYAEYIELCDFENGKTKEVPNIYNRLRVKKQILSETEKASFDEQVYKKSCEDKIVRQQNDGVLITDIAIFPTYSCNFKCKYCYESSFLQSAFLTERDIDKICKFIQEINQTDGSTSEEFAKRTKDGTYEKFFKTGSRLLRRDMAKNSNFEDLLCSKENKNL